MMPSEDPFSSVRISKLSKPFQSQTIQNKEKLNDPFQSVRMIKESEESVLSTILRGGTRTASRAVETLAGVPGDLGSIIQSGVLSGLEKIVGIPASSEAHEKMRGYRPPTSQELQSLSEDVSKGYTKPQSDKEREVDEFTKTVSSLLGPIKFRRALGLAAAGTGVGKGLEVLGFDEPIKDAGKFGTIFALSMFNPQGVQNLYKGLYDKVHNNIPNMKINVTPLETRLSSIERNLQKGVSTTTKQAVLKPIQELKSKIQNGEISAEDLIRSRFDLNELMGDPELLKRGKNAFPLVVSAVNKAIKGSHQLGKVLKRNLSEADEAFGAYKQSRKASDFIKESLNGKPLKHALLATGIEALTYPEAIIPSAGALIAGGGVIKFYELMNRINANPTMRKYYAEMIKSAVNENKVSLIKFTKKLDEEFFKEDRIKTAKLKKPTT